MIEGAPLNNGGCRNCNNPSHPTEFCPQLSEEMRILAKRSKTQSNMAEQSGSSTRQPDEYTF